MLDSLVTTKVKAYRFICNIVGSEVYTKRALSVYFERLFGVKGLLDTALYREVRNIACALDDLRSGDGLDIFGSLGAERLVRYLYGIGLALGPVTSEALVERRSEIFCLTSSRRSEKRT